MNKSVVVNYKSNEIFATNDSPDVGYVQFVKTAERVYISVDGKSVGFVPADEFARISKITEG
jgi:hypothetical protein